MPLYDYRCSACGLEVEVMHGIHASGPTACEACGGTMNKVLSPPAIHFKGSGWAKKDAAASAKKAKPKGSSAAGKSAPSAEKPSADSSSESRSTSDGGTSSASAPPAGAIKE